MTAKWPLMDRFWAPELAKQACSWAVNIGDWRCRLLRRMSPLVPAAACRVLPPALLHLMIVLAAAPPRIAGLRVRIALEKEAEAAVAPGVAARNGDIDRRPARHEAALGL